MIAHLCSSLLISCLSLFYSVATFTLFGICSLFMQNKVQALCEARLPVSSHAQLQQDAQQLPRDAVSGSIGLGTTLLRDTCTVQPKGNDASMC